MFTLGTEWWQIVVRATIVYLAVVLALRLTGRRSLGQRNAIDLVLILIVANSVQNAMIGGDTSLLGGLIAAGTLFTVDAILGRVLYRNSRIRGFFSGSPIVLINHGQILEENARRLGINHDEIEEVLREHGIDKVGKVKTCILEIDGSLSIVPSSSETFHSNRRLKTRHNADGAGTS